jgi:hypothetical protein
LSCDRTDTLVVERQNTIGRHWAAKRIARPFESKDKSHPRELVRRALLNAQGRLNPGKGATDCLIKLD